jgi:hypothetical protein
MSDSQKKQLNGHLMTLLIGVCFAVTGALFNNVSATLNGVVSKVEAISHGVTSTSTIADNNRADIVLIRGRLNDL